MRKSDYQFTLVGHSGAPCKVPPARPFRIEFLPDYLPDRDTHEGVRDHAVVVELAIQAPKDTRAPVAADRRNPSDIRGRLTQIT